MIDALTLEKLEEILKYSLINHLPFFAYRLPNSEIIEIGIQRDLNLLKFGDFTELVEKEGFVMTPFDTSGNHSKWFMRKDLSFNSKRIDDSELSKLKLIKNKLEYSEIKDNSETEEKDYFSQISKFLESIDGKDLQKVILSRILNEQWDSKNNKAALFTQLCMSYPHAFVSFVSLPGQCLWMGASPEILLKSSGKYVKTVALAGTLPVLNSDLDSICWGQKEIDEQAFVSDYIESVFKANKIDHFKKKGPFTVQAGQIAHLKTEYKIDQELSFKLKAKMISTLHPTPAVCGLPKQKALDIIKAIEGHDREYYAGYLGPIHKNGDLALYVNLRSMKITENQLSLFVGGGITKDSIPQKEWDETQHKAQTLLSVIKAKNHSR